MYMAYVVSITSQGQISIPAQIRRDLNLDKTRKALITIQGNKAVIEPLKDLLELKGSFKTKIKADSDKIRASFEQYLAKEGVKGMK